MKPYKCQLVSSDQFWVYDSIQDDSSNALHVPVSVMRVTHTENTIIHTPLETL